MQSLDNKFEAGMRFRFQGLPSDQFSPLFALDDDALAVKGFTRITADEKPGFPCRVSLADAELGEELLLVNFEHQSAHSPYRACGPVFVRRDVSRFDSTEVPPALRPRLLSLRGYDGSGMMVDADVVEGAQIERFSRACSHATMFLTSMSITRGADVSRRMSSGQDLEDEGTVQ
jgi:hypothetical protein